MVSGNIVTVASSSGFNAGDRVLIIQMQGADINTANTSSFGDITAYNSAGNWEYGVINSISGNDITLDSTIQNTYDPNGKVQLVTVPVFCDASVDDTLTCQAWNGTTGGVLVFFSNGTVTLNSDINVSGKGFRGGPTCIGPWGCGNTAYYLNNTNCSGGKKGEGIWVTSGNNYTGGRGKVANGGGGGNPGNCGGGGGANFGTGGMGGYEYSLCFNTIQGIPGQTLDYTMGRLFMGGAGGTGFNDNSQTQYAGSNGGGIIIISANTLIGNSQNISSNGLDINGVTNDESAGGGGAGGIVCLDIQTYSGNVNVNVNGGKGGGTYNYIFVPDCHGPGGGGGGGAIWVKDAVLPGAVIPSTTGGIPGLVLNPSSSCYNTPWGATNGQDGSVLFNFPSQTLIPPSQVSLGPDTIICPDQVFILHAGDNYLSYVWQDGSTDSLFAASDSGMYYVQVADSGGCFSYDTVLISLYPPVSIPILNDTIVCPGEDVLLVAGDGSDTYLWQDGSTGSSLMTDAPGLYWVQVTDSLGCSAYDSSIIINFTAPLLDLGNDTSLCPGDMVIFSAGTYALYEWQDGSTQANFITGDLGEYSVIVVDSNGCFQYDTVVVISYYDVPPDDLVPDTIVCPDVPRFLMAPDNYISYEWNDGSTEQSLEIDQPGTYWVRVTNEHNCVNTDTIFVKAECPTGIWVPNAFSPNGDGINDFFTAIGYNVTEYHMSIFNRWGEIIYITDQMDDGWDGKYEGRDSEVGAYVYLISFIGELNGLTSSGTYKGNVTLVR